MNKLSVLCIGDSLGLPREGISYRDTWFYLLSQSSSRFVFINRFQRGLTTNMIVGQNRRDFLDYYEPDIVLMQVGIVDCAPRYLKNRSLLAKILGVLPKRFSTPMWGLIKQYGKRSPQNADVLPNAFERNLVNFFNRCMQMNVKKVVVIKIASPSQNMIKNNPEITKQVLIYNSLIDKLKKEYEIVEVVDPLLSGSNNMFLEDGYHLNANGNMIIFKHIEELLSKVSETYNVAV